MNPLIASLYDFEFIFYIIFGSICSLLIAYLFIPLPHKFKYILERYFSNVAAIGFSLIIISICTISLIRWFNIYRQFDHIENYFYITIIILSISLTFSVLEWTLSIFQSDSFIISNQYFDKLKLISNNTANKHIEMFEDRISILNSILPLFNTDLVVKVIEEEISYELEIIIIKADPFVKSPTLSRHFTIVYTSDDNLQFVIYEAIHQSGGSVQNTVSNYLIYDNSVYHFREGNKVKYFTKYNSSQVILIVKNLIIHEANSINKKILYEKDFMNGDVVIPFTDFVFNNMYELFSIRQGYFIPSSNVAKLIHFIFGIYKFIFLGSLISLILSK